MALERNGTDSQKESAGEALERLARNADNRIVCQFCCAARVYLEGCLCVMTLTDCLTRDNTCHVCDYSVCPGSRRGVQTDDRVLPAAPAPAEFVVAPESRF